MKFKFSTVLLLALVIAVVVVIAYWSMRQQAKQSLPTAPPPAE